MSLPAYVTISSGMRGYYALLVDGNTHEPIQTGIGSYETPEGAISEAKDWAMAEEIRFDYQEPTKEHKVAYVKRAGQTRNHHCHWPGCPEQVPPAKWGCFRHWMMLPKYLRDKIWASFRPGQEKNWTPTREYVTVAKEVQNWIIIKESGL